LFDLFDLNSDTNYTVCVCCRPFEVFLVNSLVADWTFAPRLVIQRQIVQHTRPAVDVSTASYLRCSTSKHVRVRVS